MFRSLEIITTLFIFMSLPLVIYAQSTFQIARGGTGVDIISSVQQTAGGNYILLGTTSSFGAGNDDIYVLLIDDQGSVIWEQTIGGSWSDEGFDIKETSDGGFIIAGKITQTIFNIDAAVIKLDGSGNVSWSKKFGASQNDYAYGVSETSNGEFIITGQTASYGSGLADVLVLKLDANGNQIWFNAIGGTASEAGYKITEGDSQNEYFITGGTFSFGLGQHDGYSILIDTLGNIINSQTYGDAFDDHLEFGSPTNDGGYIMTGHSRLSGSGDDDVFLVKVNASGNEEWSTSFGGGNHDFGYCVQQTADNGYIIVGKTQSFGAGGNDVYLIKTDHLGNIQWSQTYGGTGDDIGYSVTQTPDGGYFIGGSTESFGSGQEDIYFIKTDAAGNSNCNENNTTSAVVTGSQTTNPSSILTTAGSINTVTLSVSPSSSTLDLQCINISTCPPLNLSASTIMPSCAFSSDGSISINVGVNSSPFSYEWSTSGNDSTALLSDITAGIYHITVTDSSNCNSSLSITLQDPSPVEVTLLPSDSSLLCSDSKIDSLFSFASGGNSSYTYLWSTGDSNPILTNLIEGTYRVTVTDTNNCSAESSMTFTAPPQLFVNITSQDTGCIGDIISIASNPSGGNPSYTYLWNNGIMNDSVLVTLVSDTLISLTISDANECNADTSLNLFAIDSVTITSSGPFCNSASTQSLTASVSGGVWTGQGIVDSLNGIFDPSSLGAGLYTISYTAGNCINQPNILVEVTNAPSITGNVSDQSCSAKNDGEIVIEVTEGKEPYIYQWSDLSTTKNIESLQAGTYNVTVIDVNNCSGTNHFDVNELQVLCGDPHIYVPNIFSPNNDGVNDELFVFGEGIKLFHFTIFDRWGEIIFESQDLSKGWDGTFNGKMLNSAVFVYQITGTFENSVPFNETGNITILR